MPLSHAPDSHAPDRTTPARASTRRLLLLSLFTLLAVLVTGLPKAQAASTVIQPGDNWASVLASAPAGSTVTVATGSHPKQDLVGKDFRGITLVGASRTGTVVKGLYLKDVSNLTLRNLTVSMATAQTPGIGIAFGTHHVTMDHIGVKMTSQNSGNGIEVMRGGTTAPHDIAFSYLDYDGSAARGTGANGLVVWAGNVTQSQWPLNISVRNCGFYKAPADLIQIGGGRSVTIADSRLSAPQSNTVHNDGVQSYASDKLTLARNVFTAAGAYESDDNAIMLGAGPTSSVYLRVQNTVVQDNVVKAWRGQGISLAGTSTVSLTGNKVSAISTPGSGLVLSGGNWNLRNTGLSIIGNTIARAVVLGDTASIVAESGNSFVLQKLA